MTRGATTFAGDEDTVRSRFGVFAAAATVVFIFLMLLGEQAGVPEHLGYLATGALLVVAFAVPGLGWRTGLPAQWLHARHSVASALVGMSLAGCLVAASFWFLAPGDFFAGSFAGAALAIGPLTGVALASILFAPHLRKSGATSPAAYFSVRLGGRAAPAIGVATVAATSLLMLWTQFILAGSLAALYFPISATAATGVAAILAIATIAPGGLLALVRSSALAFAILATAFLAPLIWIAAVTGGLPLPQLSYGGGALAEVSGLETQLRGLDIKPLGEIMTQGALAAGGPLDAILLTLFLALGFAAAPALLIQFDATRRVRTTRPAAAWAIVFCAAIVTAAPAAAAFVKLAIYNGIFGLTTSELDQAAGWLLRWSALESPLAPGQPLAALCGQTVRNVEAAIAACGGSAEHALSSADLTLRSEIVGLALPDLVRLPAVFAMVLGAGLVATAIAAANACAFGFATAFSSGAAHKPGARGSSALWRLFIARLMLTCGVAAAAWLAISHRGAPLEPALYALSLSVSALAPALALSVWWDRASSLGIAAGMASAIGINALAWALSTYGFDLTAGTGDEMTFALPWVSELPTPVHVALVAFPISLALMIGISLRLGHRPDPDRLDALRAPDREAAVGDLNS